jgi:hypothetical protein
MNENDDSPPDPVADAIAALGEPISVHRVSGGRVQWKVSIGFGLIILGIILNVLWWTFGLQKMAHVLWHLLYMPFAFGIGLIGQVMWNRGVTIYHYPAGILRVGRGKVETFLWDEIASIKVRSDTGKVFGIRGDDQNWKTIWIAGKIPFIQLWKTWIELTRTDGTKLKLTPIFEGYETLAEQIQRTTFERTAPTTLQKIAAGEPFAFGPWVVNIDGITMLKSHIAWKDIKKVTMNGRILSLSNKSLWRMGKSVDISTLDNPHILMAIMDSRIPEMFEFQTPIVVAKENESEE